MERRVEVASEEEKQEEDEDAEPKRGVELCALVQVRVPKKAPEPVEDEEGNSITPEVPEDQLEDIPIEDKCLSTATILENQQIMVFNQAAAATLRKEIATEFKGSVDALSKLDIDEFCEVMESEAIQIEQNFCEAFIAKQKTEEPLPLFVYRPAF